jgi:hypothetical protein
MGLYRLLLFRTKELGYLSQSRKKIELLVQSNPKDYITYNLKLFHQSGFDIESNIQIGASIVGWEFESNIPLGT